MDNYQLDISYPYYIRQKPDGINIADTMINKLIELGGVNFTIRCMSCHSLCHSNRMYCEGCYHLLSCHLNDSRSFCN